MQYNVAVTIAKSKRQWIDLGLHPEVCMTHKYFCGPGDGGIGAAFSPWLNIIDCSGFGGIMTTETNEEFHHTGFNMHCAIDSENLW